MTASDHLVELGRGWSMWKWIWLRGAGFPAHGLLAIGSDALVAHLDHEAAAEERLRNARAAALAASRAANPERVTTLVAANQVPAKDTGNADVDARLVELRAADAALRALRGQTQGVIAAERAKVAAAVRAVGRDPRFREALTWQNRSVLHNAVDTLLRGRPDEDDTKSRERHRLVAKYYQRYSVKNETIGFFGPSAWVELDGTQQDVRMTPGPNLFAERRVSFESWPIEALAAVLSERAEMCSVFVPRRKPFSRLDGNVLHLSPAAPRSLSDADAYLLARADGRTRARDIARAATSDPASGIPSVEAGYEALARLGQQGFISWGIDIPADLEHPERWLRRELEAVDDPAIRADALAPLDGLVAARDAVTRAAGDPEALDKAITALEAEFAATTALAVKRGHGKAYAGRQVFYEDCLRMVDVQLGRRFLSELEVPLGLVLASARWYTWEIACSFRAKVAQVYRSIVEPDGDRRVPLGALMVAMGRMFTGDQYRISPFVEDVRDELHRRWATLIAIDDVAPETRVLQLHSAKLREAVEREFAAPGPGWPRARYHSPDMMIAAKDVAAINAGDYFAVLGELHCGTNTLLARAAYRLHPDRESVKAAWDRDMSRVCIAPVLASADRSTHLPVSDTDRHVELSWARSWRPRDHVFAGGDFYIEDIADRLVVRSYEGDVEYDIVAFMEHYLCSAVAPHFNLFPKRRHRPRIVIDKLVVSRESWSFVESDFAPLLEKATPSDLVYRVGRWAREHGLPRFVFGKVPREAKPFYVDFGSPVLIEIFVRHLREASTLSLSEFYPSYDELWLQDSDGARYTSELRFACIDPERWSEG